MITAADLVRRYLLADPAIAAALGTRIYPVKLPQDTVYPALTIQRLVTVRRGHLRGPGTLEAPLYQLDVWTQERSGAAGFQEARDLADLIRLRIDGYAGILEDAGTGARVRVDIHLADARELYDSDVNGGYFRISADYTIWNQPVTNGQ